MTLVNTVNTGSNVPTTAGRSVTDLVNDKTIALLGINNACNTLDGFFKKTNLNGSSTNADDKKLGNLLEGLITMFEDYHSLQKPQAENRYINPQQSYDSTALVRKDAPTPSQVHEVSNAQELLNKTVVATGTTPSFVDSAANVVPLLNNPNSLGKEVNKGQTQSDGAAIDGAAIDGAAMQELTKVNDFNAPTLNSTNIFKKIHNSVMATLTSFINKFSMPNYFRVH